MVSWKTNVVCTLIDEIIGIEGIPDFTMDNLVCIWNEYQDPNYLLWNTTPAIYYGGNELYHLFEVILPYWRSGVWCDETRVLLPDYL